MQPQELDIGDQQAGALDRRHDLRQRRDVAARENVLGDPGIGDVGPFGAADGVQQHDAVVEPAGRRICGKKHRRSQARRVRTCRPRRSGRTFRHVAIVLQAEVDRGGQVLFAARCLAIARCSSDSVMPVTCALQNRRDRAQARPSRSRCRVRGGRRPLSKKLGGEMALLGELGVVERLVGGLEIGAAVLPVGVEKERIEPAVQIVVVRDIAPRPRRQVELLQPAVEIAAEPLQARPDRAACRRGSGRARAREGRRSCLPPSQRAVHVGFAEP